MKALLPIVLCVGFAACRPAGSSSSPGPNFVDSAELGRTVSVRGLLGQPLGKMITIEGKVVYDVPRSKDEQSETFFRVAKVDGTKLSEPQVIRLSFFGFLSVPRPSDDANHTYRGYEDGRFDGTPSEAFIEAGTTWQDRSWHFHTYFQVIK